MSVKRADSADLDGSIAQRRLKSSVWLAIFGTVANSIFVNLYVWSAVWRREVSTEIVGNHGPWAYTIHDSRMSDLLNLNIVWSVACFVAMIILKARCRPKEGVGYLVIFFVPVIQFVLWIVGYLLVGWAFD